MYAHFVSYATAARSADALYTTEEFMLGAGRQRMPRAGLRCLHAMYHLIAHRAIRRGSFRSVRDLVQKIDRFVAHYNTHKRPFAWTATADSIFAKLQRLCKVICGTQH